jgi:hypothetical protein
MSQCREMSSAEAALSRQGETALRGYWPVAGQSSVNEAIANGAICLQATFSLGFFQRAHQVPEALGHMFVQCHFPSQFRPNSILDRTEPVGAIMDIRLRWLVVAAHCHVSDLA